MIINPNGPTPEGESERPSNVQTLDFVKKQVAEQEAQKLADRIVSEGEAASPEMIERRRKQGVTAFTITLQQFDQDAQLLEEGAMDPALSINERHQKMDQARALRMSMTWLMALVQVSTGPDGGKTAYDRVIPVDPRHDGK